MKIIMKERVIAATIAAKENRRVNSMSALANEMGWSRTVAQKVCHASGELMAIINSNKPQKKQDVNFQVRQERKQRANLRPIIKQLKSIIEKSGMNYPEISKKAGMSQQFFYDVFNSGHLPRLDSLLAVCDVLGVELSLVRVVNNADNG